MNHNIFQAFVTLNIKLRFNKGVLKTKYNPYCKSKVLVSFRCLLSRLTTFTKLLMRSITYVLDPRSFYLSMKTNTLVSILVICADSSDIKNVQ